MSRHVSRKLRQHVFERDGFCCVHCGRTAEDLASTYTWLPSMVRQLHVDHIIPYINGGPTTAWNLVAACPRCNLGRQHRGFDLVLLAQTHQKEAATA